MEIGNPMGQSYKDLIAWQKAMELAKLTYRVTEDFPKREIYGMAAQMRRCAVSVPSNIAEGQGRLSNLDFRKFLSNALGSLVELETQSTLAADFKFIQPAQLAEIEQRAAEIGRLINGLVASINAREAKAKSAKGSS
jgi:four helix bundle protein